MSSSTEWKTYGDGPLITSRGCSSTERSRIQRACEAKKLFRLAESTYVPREVWEGCNARQQRLLRIVGEAKSRPSMQVVGSSAAHVYGLPIPSGRREWGPIELGREAGTGGCPRRGVRIRHLPKRALSASSIVRTPFGDVRVSNPVETAAQLALWSDLESAVIAVEGAFCAGLLEESDREEVFTAIGRRNGHADAHRAMRLITPFSESPRESEVKLELWKRGLPVPYQQVEIFDSRNFRVGRVDFMFDCGLVLEYDGLSKYKVEDAWGKDQWHEPTFKKERQREIEIQNQGFVVMRCSATSFRTGVWLRELEDLLEMHRQMGRKAPAGRWKAKGRAWIVDDWQDYDWQGR